VQPSGGSGTISLPDEVADLWNWDSTAGTTLINLGNPHVGREYRFGMRIDTFSDSETSIRVAMHRALDNASR
jgi:hypothetical protein